MQLQVSVNNYYGLGVKRTGGMGVLLGINSNPSREQ